ncbi:hypothetical protein SODALDRAFT_327179 [Sodiomyces alkalinus F11]|uniref:Rhodopsin domain-containing protein n=1 Tax=Sodiomyces alkalinus (strain CBS 110278 / VKM F-3762 / F11) TaxID=1314773 RepID=A0A3N2Q8A9_SODAK|nr:hypothetical protein SODALDRAFT_327179 [Sodiomyces alkalinus F11]ROT43009.1 hypothetical protein SODALDRAFT_327179 [Sodiomyces alkalinus F11]
MAQAIEAAVRVIARAAQAQAEEGPLAGPGAPGGPAAPPVFTDDYEYPYSPLQHVGFFILFFFPALALIAVSLRIYTRIKTKQPGWDDFFIVLAMLDSLAETGASYVAMRKAFLGVHVWDIPPQADPREGQKWNFIIQILYNPILALVKTSILLFLLRLGGQQRRVRWAIHLLNAFNLSLMVAIFVTVIFQCTPVSFFWEQFGPGADPNGKCINMGAFYVSTSALNVLTDLLVLALPFWIFLGLKMPKRVKIALLGVFALGGVVTIISILRLVWMIDVSFYPMGPDPTYDIRFTYSAVETNLAIIAASAPALRGLFVKWFPRIFSSLKSTRQPGYGYQGGTGDKKQSRGHNTGTLGSHLQTNGDSSFQMKNMKSGVRSTMGGSSPTTSEEEIMRYNGIMRTTDVDVVFDDKSSAKGEDGRGKVSADDHELGPRVYSAADRSRGSL